MQNQSQNVEWNMLNGLKCQRHPDEKILFLCICSESCPMDKLLCMECIDTSGKDHQHHLVSIGRFHTFLTTYSKQIQNTNKKTQQGIDCLRREVNQNIDQLQQLTLNELDIFGTQDNPDTEQEKEEKLRQIVSRKIWSKLQINANNEKNVHEEIQAQISQYWDVTLNVFNEMLCSVSDLCTKHLQQIKTNQNRIAFFGSEPNSSHEVETIKQTDSSGRTKSNTMKRYSYNERLEVIEEVKVYESQMSTAMSKRLVAKRRKIAMSTVTRWLRWWKTASTRNRYKQEKKAKQ